MSRKTAKRIAHISKTSISPKHKLFIVEVTCKNADHARDIESWVTEGAEEPDWGGGVNPDTVILGADARGKKAKFAVLARSEKAAHKGLKEWVRALREQEADEEDDSEFGD